MTKNFKHKFFKDTINNYVYVKKNMENMANNMSEST